MNNPFDTIILLLNKKLQDENLEHSFIHASTSSLNYLKEASYPSILIDFYRKYEPEDCIEYNEIRLWNIRELIIENTEMTPGYILFPLGYRVFGTTIYGDVLCINKNDDKEIVYIASHDEITEGLPEIEIKSKMRIIASNFIDFMNKYISKEF